MNVKGEATQLFSNIEYCIIRVFWKQIAVCNMGANGERQPWINEVNKTLLV